MAETDCNAVWLSHDTARALQRAEFDRDPAAHAEAAKGVVQCARGRHEGHDHKNGDCEWNDAPEED